jgi:Flp pilus assembly pilin Flp
MDGSRGWKVSLMLKRIRDIIRDDKGVAPLEYALIAGLIFSAIINAGLALNPKLSKAYNNIGNTLVAHDRGT